MSPVVVWVRSFVRSRSVAVTGTETGRSGRCRRAAEGGVRDGRCLARAPRGSGGEAELAPYGPGEVVWFVVEAKQQADGRKG